VPTPAAAEARGHSACTAASPKSHTKRGGDDREVGREADVLIKLGLARRRRHPRNVCSPCPDATRCPMLALSRRRLHVREMAAWRFDDDDDDDDIVGPAHRQVKFVSVATTSRARDLWSSEANRWRWVAMPRVSVCALGSLSTCRQAGTTANHRHQPTRLGRSTRPGRDEMIVGPGTSGASFWIWLHRECLPTRFFTAPHQTTRPEVGGQNGWTRSAPSQASKMQRQRTRASSGVCKCECGTAQRGRASHHRMVISPARGWLSRFVDEDARDGWERVCFLHTTDTRMYSQRGQPRPIPKTMATEITTTTTLALAHKQGIPPGSLRAGTSSRDVAPESFFLFFFLLLPPSVLPLSPPSSSLAHRHLGKGGLWHVARGTTAAASAERGNKIERFVRPCDETALRG
jgi:hypothetical protein